MMHTAYCTQRFPRTEFAWDRSEQQNAAGDTHLRSATSSGAVEPLLCVVMHLAPLKQLPGRHHRWHCE